MSNCEICNKVLGLFENNIMTLVENDHYSERTIKICNDCSKIVSQFHNALNYSNKQKAVKELKSRLLHAKDDVTYGIGFLMESKQRSIEKYEKEEQIKNEEKRIQNESLKINTEQIHNHLLTTGFSFEGYKIVKYNGLVSGENVLGTGFLSEFMASFSDFAGSESIAFSDKMTEVKEAAKTGMIKRSVAMGGNAIIGIDYNYITFNTNMIGVSANGTSVVIEKIEE